MYGVLCQEVRKTPGSVERWRTTRKGEAQQEALPLEFQQVQKDNTAGAQDELCKGTLELKEQVRSKTTDKMNEQELDSDVWARSLNQKSLVNYPTAATRCGSNAGG